MRQQRRFTKEFEDEAVRLVRASGRTQREIAEDLGVGLSTLVRWISRSRDRQIDHPPAAGDEDGLLLRYLGLHGNYRQDGVRGPDSAAQSLPDRDVDHRLAIRG